MPSDRFIVKGKTAGEEEEDEEEESEEETDEDSSSEESSEEMEVCEGSLRCDNTNGVGLGSSCKQLSFHLLSFFFNPLHYLDV